MRCSKKSRYSITSSATSSRSRGISRSSDLAVLRLMTNSNRVGCSTGRSAGLAPLRILSTYTVLRRNKSLMFAIGDETAELDKLARLSHGGQSVRCGKLDDASSREEEHRGWKQEQRLSTLFHHRGECAFKFFRGPYLDQLKVHSQGSGGGLCCLQHVSHRAFAVCAWMP